MEKRMQKMTAALLAVTCLPVTGITTGAAELPTQWTGATIWASETFEERELVNHHGILGDTQLYVEKTIQDSVYFVIPQTKMMRFVLRSDVDPDTGTEQAAEVLEAYFPGIKDCLVTSGYYVNTKEMGDPDRVQFNQVGAADSRVLELRVNTVPENNNSIACQILVDLARRHLISEYYGWGEVAECKEGSFGKEILGSFTMTDPESVQDYLTAHYPGYTVEKVENKSDTLYRIVGAEEKSVKEQFELAAELMEQFKVSGVDLQISGFHAAAPTLIGHNALEHPGDTNLDCAVDILDVIAANKHILGVGTLDKTGLKNADMNGNGTADAEDSLAILKKVLQ